MIPTVKITKDKVTATINKEDLPTWEKEGWKLVKAKAAPKKAKSKK